MTARRLRISDSPQRLAQDAADHLAEAISALVERFGACSVALAGGSTPRATYALLAQRDDVPWDKLSIYFGDERCVPPDHPESNYRMAREALLDHVPIPADQIHRMEGEDPDRDAAADRYAARLPERLDVVLLGVGEDAHTASLFPGGDAVRETQRRVVPVLGPKPPPWRLTLTPPTLEAARHLVVLAAGAGKRAPVQAALNFDPVDLDRYPIQLARRGFFLLDEAAAGASRPPHPGDQEDTPPSRQ